MDKIYDVIVIGAGNGGLISALEFAKENKKVLVLESNNVSGGFASSFKRGRFEFEASLHELCGYGTKEKPGEIYNLFNKLGIADDLEFVTVPEAFHVYSMDTKEDYKMPFGMQEFIDKMEEYVPGSETSMKKFFILAEETKEAFAYLEENKNNIDNEVLLEKYANFMKVSTHSVAKVLDSIKMPKKAQEILTSYWVYLGSSASTLSFVHYASMVMSYINLGAQIPVNRSHGISAVIENEILKNNGEIKYFSTVQRILFEDEKIVGVQLSDGKKYFAKHVICNCSPTLVYGNMIPKKYVPKNALKLTNSRVLGARGFSIFLGLNQSAEALGLTDYSYFIFHSLDSDKEYQNMSRMDNNSSVAIVLNNAIKDCSPKGTTIMNFTSLFFGDVFTKNVTEENYFELKNKIAENIISAFEDTTGIDIKPYIEEIEIATPVTYARYGKHPDGVIYGYKVTGLDNILPRIMCMDEEEYIPNLHFCGGFDIRADGYSSAYISGDIAARKTLKDMEGEE